MKLGTIAIILLLSGIASAGGTSYIQANGQLIAKINETNITYYHPDHLGSSSVMTDEDGEVASESRYLPFGQPLSGNEKYGFTGKELDETGLNYFGARYYSPGTGRFITFDPMGQQYIYAYNNPLKYNDPDGRFPAAVGAIAIAGGGNGWNPLGPVLLVVAGGATAGWVVYRIHRYVTEDRKTKDVPNSGQGPQPKNVPVKAAEKLSTTESIQITKPLPTRIVDGPTNLAMAWKEVIEPAEPLPLSCLVVGGGSEFGGPVTSTKIDEFRPDDLVLGLAYNLDLFIENKGGKKFFEFYDEIEGKKGIDMDSFPIGPRIQTVINFAKAIKFNLEGMTPQHYEENIWKGFVKKNMANAELYHIVTNEELRRKTTLYIGNVRADETSVWASWRDALNWEDN